MTPAELTARAVRVHKLVWRETWHGENDDIPTWTTANAEGHSFHFSFAGRHKLERHSDAPPDEVAFEKALAQERYEARICAALTTGENDD